MKRLIFGVALFALLASAAVAAQPQTLPPPQNGPQNPPQTMGPPPSHRFLHRYKYSSYGVWVRTNAPGHAAYRYTYAGQKDGFPMPAIFQSGGEHNNWTYGVGF